MDYQDYINELSVLLPTPLASGGFNAAAPFQDARYNTAIPRAIEYAELMIYRDPDIKMQTMNTVNSASTLTAGSRNFTIPGSIIVLDDVNVIVPNGDTPAQGTRVHCLQASLDTINAFWPNEATQLAPSLNGPGPYYAILNDTTLYFAPTPDMNYTLELRGQVIPSVLSQSALATTYLTTNYPDLFIAASMIYWTAVMKDYGAQTDDPRMALSWSQQYQAEKTLAASFEARKRFEGSGWTSQPQAKLGTSMRGGTSPIPGQ